MQIILCGPFDDDEPIPYGRCSCSYACGSRERVRGDASLVEMCASLSAPPRLYLLFYLQSKKTISSNILLKYNTSYAKNKWLSCVILAFFTAQKRPVIPSFFHKYQNKTGTFIFIHRVIQSKKSSPQVVEKVINISVDNYENMNSTLLIR